MPSDRKIQKEDVLKVALEIVEAEGPDALTARRIAQELSCSVQPVFYNFKTMEELKQATYQTMYMIYQKYMAEAAEKPQAYKHMGMAYIRFARHYPNFFKTLFMSRTEMTPEHFIDNDVTGTDIIQKGQMLTGFGFEEQKRFHLKVWIFTHGLATLVVSGTVQISDEDAERLLVSTVREMLIGVKSEEER